MSEMAKSARAALKAKASRMAHGDPNAKVDASSWTPSEPLNTEAKTGRRPVSRRAFKAGGKVDGKDAVKHAGRKPRKTGGFVASCAADDTKEANKTPHTGGYNKGGRTRKAAGGGMGSGIGSTAGMPPGMAQAIAPGTMQGVNGGLPPGLASGIGSTAGMPPGMAQQAPPQPQDGPSPFKRGGHVKGANGKSGTRPTGGRKAHASGGAARRYVGSDEVTADEAPEALGVARPRTGMIRGEGGKLAKSNPVIIAARKADEPEGRKIPSAAERDKAYKAHREKNPLPARKLGMIDRALNKIEGHKKGGRTERKAGGRTKGKTNINIIISTGKGQGQGQPPMMPPPMPPGGAPVPVPAAHPPMPPMGGGAPPPAPPPMPRKSGGRAAARTSGYKSLEAGAGSGLGRLQKAHSSK